MTLKNSNTPPVTTDRRLRLHSTSLSPSHVSLLPSPTFHLPLWSSTHRSTMVFNPSMEMPALHPAPEPLLTIPWLGCRVLPAVHPAPFPVQVPCWGRSALAASLDQLGYGCRRVWPCSVWGHSPWIHEDWDGLKGE